MVNSSWFDAFPQGRSHYLRFHGSNHRPVVSSFDVRRKKQSKIFRYDRRLKDIEEVRTLIDSTWNASPSSPVSRRLSDCRRAIAKWSRDHHNNSRETIASLQIELDAAMLAKVSDEIIAGINKAVLDAYKAEEAFWKQRSRLLWLTLGDRNTGFFHAISKGRKARNRLTVLETPEGLPVYEEEQIVVEVARYFDDIFASIGTVGENVVQKALSPRISQETNAKFTNIPTEAEIKKPYSLSIRIKHQVPTDSQHLSSKQIGRR